MNCYLIGSSSHTREVLLDAGGHHLAHLRLRLHILSCTAINVTTGMHIHSQYTECTMSNLFFGRETFSLQHVNCLILPVSARFQKCKDRGRMLVWFYLLCG